MSETPDNFPTQPIAQAAAGVVNTAKAKRARKRVLTPRTAKAEAKPKRQTAKAKAQKPANPSQTSEAPPKEPSWAKGVRAAQASGRGGRPSVYSKRKGAEICRLLSGGFSLRKICVMPGMPAMETVLGWVTCMEPRYEEFTLQYRRARDIQAEVIAESTWDISDDDSGDTYINKDGVAVPNAVKVARDRLRADNRKWFAGKVAPKRWGDEPAQTTVNIAVGRMSNAELEARLGVLCGSLAQDSPNTVAARTPRIPTTEATEPTSG